MSRIDKKRIEDHYKNTIPSHSHATFTVTKQTFEILGEKYECPISHNDLNIAMIIATLNVLGEPYWIELKKQGCTLHSDISDFIENRLKIISRDKKVDDILK